MKTFTQKLSELMTTRDDMSQVALSRAIEVDESIISKWFKEPAKRKPTAEQLFRISKYFDVTMEYLVDDSLEQPDALTLKERAILFVVREFGADSLFEPQEKTDPKSHLEKLHYKYLRNFSMLSGDRNSKGSKLRGKA